MSPAWSHTVQFVAEPRQLWQVALQLAHVVAVCGTRYCPIEHVYEHVPAPASNVPPARHAVHAVAVAPVQLAQLESHPAQLAPTSAYVLAGHVPTQLPESK